jgi:hypothetical protein
MLQGLKPSFYMCLDIAAEAATHKTNFMKQLGGRQGRSLRAKNLRIKSERIFEVSLLKPV